MFQKSLGAFVSYTFGLTVVTIIAFFAFNALHIESGQFIDWISGLLTVWWLLVIVTVPWNVHFEAKAVLDEFAHSRTVGIKIDEKHEKYVKAVSNYSIAIAIALHLLSAGALFMLSATGISKVGYVGSVVALLLTVVRPAYRAYEYMWQQLNAIKQRVKYPREDVVELRASVGELQSKVTALEHALDPNRVQSFAYEQKRSIADLQHRLERLGAEQARMNDSNVLEHQILRREAETAVAKISADNQFLDHVREIVRMIKTA